MILNTIIADALNEIASELEKLPKASFNKGLQELLRKIIKAHKRIIFNGDNYSAAWKEEAARRGLPNYPTTPEALKALVAPANIALFEKYGVFSKVEAHSRYEIFMEEYTRKIRIEGELSLNMVRTIVLPAGSKQLSELAKTIAVMTGCSLKAGLSTQKAMADTIGKLLDSIDAECGRLEKALSLKDGSAKIVDSMVALRKSVDLLEKSVDDELWPLPKYREMLFIN